MRISDWSSDVCSSDLTFRSQTVSPILIFTKSQPRSLLSMSERICRSETARNLILGWAAWRNEHGQPLSEFEDRAGKPTSPGLLSLFHHEIGRASCRERVCQYVYI